MPEYSQSTIHMRSPDIEEVLAERIAVAGGDRERVGRERGAHRLGFAKHVVIAGGQVDGLVARSLR